MTKYILIVFLLLGPLMASSPLPTDEALVKGTLDNGMKYILQKNDKPPGKASIWLHVSSGSLDEDENQLGIAHFLEHMAFNGSENFPPGELIKYSESSFISPDDC